MKYLTLLVSALFALSPLAAQTPGFYQLSKKKPSGAGFLGKEISDAPNTIWGTDSSGDPITRAIGSFLAPNGNGSQLTGITASQITGIPTQTADVQVFDVGGTFEWTKPNGAVNGTLFVVGAGGGGASGKRGTPTGASQGGGGGSAGALISVPFNALTLGATEVVIVGAEGAGGASATTNGSLGSDGGDGGSSSFGSIAVAIGGKGGKATNAGGSVTTNSNYVYPNTGLLATMPGGSANSAPTTGSTLYPSGGGAGGSTQLNPPDVVSFNAGAGAPTLAQTVAVPGRALGGLAGVAEGDAGMSGATQLSGAGTGGGGGRGNTNGKGGKGGDGGLYGGGGGGGGSSSDGFDSGAGGKGARGIVIVVTFCSP